MTLSSQPPLTVIVPVYNVKPYLTECLDSLIAQTLPGIEIIVVDDKSDDGSREVLRAYEARTGLSIVHLKQRSGVSAARNVGLRLATGRYVGFVDGDDEVAPTMFSELYAAASLHDADIAVCGFRRFSNGIYLDGELPPLPFGRKLVRPELQEILDRSHRERIVHFSWRHLFRRDLLDSADIRFPVDLRLGEDTVFNLLALNTADSLVAVPEALYNVRTRPNSATTERHRPDMLSQLQTQSDIITAYYGSLGLGVRLVDDYHQYVLEALLPMLLGNSVQGSTSFAELDRLLGAIAQAPLLRDATYSRSLARRGLATKSYAKAWLMQHGYTKPIAGVYWAGARKRQIKRRTV